MKGKLRPDLAQEALIWRPILAGVLTVGDVKRGDVDLIDILKINALLDMQDATNDSKPS